MWKNVGLFALGLGLGGVPVTLALVHRARQPSERVAAAPSSESVAAAPSSAPAQTDPPWLKKQPRVTYSAPASVPDVLYKKYQSFEATWSSDGVDHADPPSTLDHADPPSTLDHADPQSTLVSRLGLRPGDRIISVNGQPIGSSADASRRLFEDLQGEKRFAVLIERDGQQLVLMFSVGD